MSDLEWDVYMFVYPRLDLLRYLSNWIGGSVSFHIATSTSHRLPDRRRGYSCLSLGFRILTLKVYNPYTQWNVIFQRQLKNTYDIIFCSLRRCSISRNPKKTDLEQMPGYELGLEPDVRQFSERSDCTRFLKKIILWQKKNVTSFLSSTLLSNRDNTRYSRHPHSQTSKGLYFGWIC